jgi:hypothetical protein
MTAYVEKKDAELLKRAGMNKAELSRQLGLHYNTVQTWTMYPQYARAYLEVCCICDDLRAQAKPAAIQITVNGVPYGEKSCT